MPLTQSHTATFPSVNGHLQTQAFGQAHREKGVAVSVESNSRRPQRRLGALSAALSLPASEQLLALREPHTQ